MKKAIFTLFLFISFCSELFSQQIGHTTITFTDPARSNRSIATEIYYPATSAGTNTPFAAGTFPVISFGHGFVIDYSAYQNIWEQLVPEGYILMFPKTETSLSPSHGEFGKDLKFLIEKIINEGNNASSFFYGKVGTTSAIMGHSMGGGASYLAGDNNQTVTTIVNMAAVSNTNPSALVAAKNITVPMLILSGVNDGVAPPDEHQDLLYDSLSSACKTQVRIIGGGHCYFANSSFQCSFGEGTSNPQLLLPDMSNRQRLCFI